MKTDPDWVTRPVLVILPAVVGGVATGLWTAAGHANASCPGNDGWQCLGEALVLYYLGTPAALLGSWILLAIALGARRATPLVPLAALAVVFALWLIVRLGHLEHWPPGWLGAAVGAVCSAAAALLMPPPVRDPLAALRAEEPRRPAE